MASRPSAPPGNGTSSRVQTALEVVLPLSGPVALVSAVAAASLYDPSGEGASPAQSDAALLRAFGTTLERAAPSAALFLIAALAFLVFAGSLWDTLNLPERPQWPAAVAGAGSVGAALMMIDTARDHLAAIVAVDAADASTVRFLLTTGWESARVVVVASSAMMLGAAVAGLRGALPRWFAVLSLVGTGGGLATIVATGLPSRFFEVVPAGGLAALSLGWTLPAGLVLVRQAAAVRRGRSGDARGPAH